MSVLPPLAGQTPNRPLSCPAVRSVDYDRCSLVRSFSPPKRLGGRFFLEHLVSRAPRPLWSSTSRRRRLLRLHRFVQSFIRALFPPPRSTCCPLSGLHAAARSSSKRSQMGGHAVRSCTRLFPVERYLVHHSSTIFGGWPPALFFPRL